jgi:thiosulfate reductase cytochrome b subunit/nitrate/TMAO reductase-like tetraheme cytochrome c subunit
MKKIFLYPIWIRIWHWFNVLLFVLLISTGISMHYSETNSMYIPFRQSMIIHNIAGILLSLIYAFYVISSIVTGNIKHYIPKLKGIAKRLFKQARFYLIGIFDNDPHPYHASEDNKFNPMQQLTYLSIMFTMMPIIILTGWLLMFPEYSPTSIFGMGGVWPMAILHIIVGFFLSVFMLGHIYLATTGNTVGDLFKSMINGWHLSDEHEHSESDGTAKPKMPKEKGKFLPALFYNPITLTGSIVSLISFVLIIFLMTLAFFSEINNPYIGIVTFVILPLFLLSGIAAVIFGIFRENRRFLSMEYSNRRMPVIDLNKPKHQVATLFISVGTIVFLSMTIFGSFKAYEYTDSDDFCAKVCHKVMEPQYSAYMRSTHYNVGCVKCHIGPTANWTTKSKLAGAYQVYQVLANVYPKPLASPIDHLRPEESTCITCHSPKHFYDEKKKTHEYYVTDEANSHYTFSMLIKVGGGNPETGNNKGIHWVMNLQNEITYYATDNTLEEIPWVRSKNKQTGEETVYKLMDTKLPENIGRSDKLRRMDCMDCHSRQSHELNPPSRSVNEYISMNRIDVKIPYIKNVGVQALESQITNKQHAYTDIKNFVWGFYNNSKYEINDKMRTGIDEAVAQLHQIYQQNYFPEMRSSWKKFPNQMGHLFSPGCFRCHDGKHVSDNGKVITNNCANCHEIYAQTTPSGPVVSTSFSQEFVHPGGLDKLIKNNNCSNCHNPGKKSVNK